MIARLVDAMPVLGSTVIPALALLTVAWALRPQGGRRWLGLHPVSATAVVSRLEAERARYRRPTGYLSPAWTVQPREVVTR